MLISLLVIVLVLGVLFSFVPIAQPFKNIALGIIAIFAILWLATALGGFGPHYRFGGGW